MGTRKESVLYCFDHQPDEIRERTKNGIETYRKGNVRLSFVDKEGKPVTGVHADICQTNHEFRHGANIFMLDEFESEEKNRIYREKFAQLFNLATVPFYWRDLEPEEGKPRFTKDSPRIYRRPAPDLCLEYCREKGIEPKCHCLNYEDFTPSWVKDKSVPEIKAKLEKRFRELAERYAGDIPSWEVTNETFTGYKNMRQYIKCSPFFFEDDFVEWSFRTADRYFPSNRLIINDYMVWDNDYRRNRSIYYMQIERLLRNGITHLDSIGMQFHSFHKREDEVDVAHYRYNPAFLYEVLDCYARFGKKLQITEMTLPAFSAEEADEEVQAEILRNVYTVFFSHPAMEAVIYWNLVDGYAAFAPQGDMTAGENVYHGGLMRFDMSEKPAFRTLYDLFHKEWHTALTLETGGDAISFRGFYGDYEMKVVHDGKEYKKNFRTSASSFNELTIVLD